jgi:hypothetical protein
VCRYTQPVVHWAWAPVLTKVCMLCCMCGGVVTVVLEAVRVCTWIEPELEGARRVMHTRYGHILRMYGHIFVYVPEPHCCL